MNIIGAMTSGVESTKESLLFSYIYSLIAHTNRYSSTSLFVASVIKNKRKEGIGMYINPFVAGILVTLLVEAIVLVGLGVYSNIKDKK